MKKKFIVLLTLIFVCSVLLLFYIINFNAVDTKNVFNYGSMSIQKIDLKLADTHEINKILQTCNYNSQNLTCFNSVPLTASTSIYQMYWILKIMKITGYDNNQTYELLDILHKFDTQNLENMKLDELRLLSGIYNLLNVENPYKSLIINFVMKHFDNISKLFFWEKQDESITDKISATYIAINIFNNLGISGENNIIKDLKTNLLNFYNNDDYFKNDDFNKNIINNGGIIVSSLKILGIKENDPSMSNEVRQKRKQWISHWDKSINSLLKNDYISVLALNNIIDINEFYKQEYIVSQNYLNDCLIAQTSLYGFGYDRMEIDKKQEVFNIEPQFLYIFINLCKKANYSFPYNKELNDYINESIENKFVKYSDIIPSPIDNYYGLVLANKFGYKYNKTNMEKMVKDFYIKSIEEDSNISDRDKLYEVYHIVLSYAELNMEFPNKDLIKNSIENYLSTLDFSNDTNIVGNIFDCKISLEIMNILKLNSDAIKEKTDKLIGSVINKDILTQSIAITFINDINNLNGNKINDQFKDRILMTIKNLNDENGGYKLKSNIEASDISSTLQAVKTISLLIGLTSDEKTKLKQFLYSLKTDNNLFKASKYGSGIDLKIIYEALSIPSYYL